MCTYRSTYYHIAAVADGGTRRNIDSTTATNSYYTTINTAVTAAVGAFEGYNTAAVLYHLRSPAAGRCKRT